MKKKRLQPCACWTSTQEELLTQIRLIKKSTPLQYIFLTKPPRNCGGFFLHLIPDRARSNGTCLIKVCFVTFCYFLGEENVFNINYFCSQTNQ
jgi:hypothetical protein